MSEPLKDDEKTSLGSVLIFSLRAMRRNNRAASYRVAKSFRGTVEEVLQLISLAASGRTRKFCSAGLRPDKNRGNKRKRGNFAREVNVALWT